MNQHLERLEGLAPIIRTAAHRLIEQAETKLKQRLLVVHTWRSMASQLALYAEGRQYDRASGEWVVVQPSAVRTKAKPGTSAHNVITRLGDRAALALDVIPLDDEGQPNWTIPDRFWDDLYDLAWRVGLDPLGDPIGSYLAGDKGHFEEPAWSLKLDGLGLILPSPDLAQL